MGKKLNSAVRISLIYAIVGGLWIVLSDSVLAAVISDAKTLNTFQTYKGWFYVLITALMLYGLVRVSERSIRANEERLNLALYGTNTGFYEWYPKTGEAYFSPTWFTMLGYASDEFPHHYDTWARLLHPEDRPDAERIVKEFLNTSASSFNAEFRMQRRDGQYRWIYTQGVAVGREDNGDITRMVGTHTDITKRKQAEDQLRLALADKETLLQELYHRTKNNMQTIMGLIDLQATQSRNEQLQKVFKETKNRIRSMALVHQKLYLSRNLSSIDLGEYIRELTVLLMESYQVEPNRVSPVFDLAHIPILIDTAVPCGLILNELISNVFKHAFSPNRPGQLRITLKQPAGDQIVLQVADDGVGLPSDFDPRKSGGVGLQTVFGITEYQLQGQVSCQTGQGVTWHLRFSDTLYQPRV